MKRPYTGHREAEALAAEPAALTAELWNAARRALARRDEPEPIWLDLPGLGTMQLVLLPEAFVVADRALGQRPVAAWTGFAPPPDRGLHEPVPCTLCHFHSRAGDIAPVVNEIMCRQLRAHLGDGPGSGPDRGAVIALPRRSPD